MKLLLVLPPLAQMNSPYPSTAYLAGYLRPKGYDVDQVDLSLELLLELFSQKGLRRVLEVLQSKKKSALKSPAIQFFLEAQDDYLATIDPVIRFLQGKDPTLALRICQRSLLPEGPRFLPLADHPELLQVFGSMGTQDQAKYLASLYLDDLVDVIRTGVDQHFSFSRYAESLAESQSSFEPLRARLEGEPNLIDQMIEEIFLAAYEKSQPDIVGFSAPFAGNLYGALRIGKICARLSKKRVDNGARPLLRLLGGGYVNTELRELDDPRLFDYIDELCFDDGERPLELILEDFATKSAKRLRTWKRLGTEIVKTSTPGEKDVPFKEISGPDFRGLKLTDYFSLLEMPNPMHRLWSDQRWNKMILAHGCYWKKCSFCDVSLDYIGRFEPARVDQLIEQIERVIAQTGTTGFHFVDEAAPPALLKALSQELIARKIKITWWGNLRFDKQFTPEVAELMADAGCVAVTGGLEVASPRILKLINKGLEIESAARVMKAFTEKNIYVHAYLMYGFPTQTEQETIDSLEVVRQLFAQKCLHSAYWHRFLATAHSPVGLDAKAFKIRLKKATPPKTGLFARYEIPYLDETIKDQTSQDQMGEGLRRALYNYMHGLGLKTPIQDWFDVRVPKTKINPQFVRKAIAAQP